MQSAIDLAAVKERAEMKANVPPYELGNPEFIVQAGIPLNDGAPSYIDAVERVATNLSLEGLTVTEVTRAVCMGITDQGIAAFEVAVKVKRTES